MLHATSASSTGLNVSQGSSLPTAALHTTETSSSRRRPAPKVATRPPSAHQSHVDSQVGVTTTGNSDINDSSDIHIQSPPPPAPISSPSTPSSTTTDEDGGTPIRHNHNHPDEEGHRPDTSSYTGVEHQHHPVGTLSAIEMNSGGLSRVPSSLRGDGDEESDDDNNHIGNQHHQSAVVPTTATQRSPSTTSSSGGAVSGATTRQSREDLLRLSLIHI
eukprot:TRINITY_DN11659_c0_g1_i2.p1 TRINITY_DN11659_c0_g1~~TRINITY_DN11659_c0_g1_i2.p1  ORF type:complete len:217 (-),score=53.17 TRINITY_DN11659_c0_g1_i2:160-810(-)